MQKSKSLKWVGRFATAEVVGEGSPQPKAESASE